MKTIKIDLPEDQVKFLKTIAQSENLTVTDIIIRAINLEKYCTKVWNNGNKILTVDKYQNYKEITRKI